MERLGNSSSSKCVSLCARHSSAAPKYGTKLSRNRSNSDPSKQPQIPRICYDRSCCSSAPLRGSNSHHPDIGGNRVRHVVHLSLFAIGVFLFVMCML
eukprot:scaffold15814_cov57-Attheya_sp.AAC.4